MKEENLSEVTLKDCLNNLIYYQNMSKESEKQNKVYANFLNQENLSIVEQNYYQIMVQSTLEAFNYYRRQYENLLAFMKRNNLSLPADLITEEENQNNHKI